MARIDEVAELAWNNSKAKEDPVFASCILDHRLKLVTHAEAVERTGLPESPSDFEKEVAKLLADPDKTDAAIRKARVEAAQANADAAAARAKDVAAEVAAEAKAASASKKEK